MRLSDLPTVAEVQAQRRSVQKPRVRVIDRAKYKTEQDRKATAFRAAVWKRDAYVCRACGCRVIRTLELVTNAGHVHHRRGRNVTPEDRYNVDAAVLLCGACHFNPAIIARFR